MTTVEISEESRKVREAHDRLLKKFEDTVTSQLRTFGVVLHDDAGNRIKPGSGEEARIVRGIARNCAQIVVLDPDCQTLVGDSHS